MINKCFLNRVEIDGGTDAFDCGDCGPVFDPFHLGYAGTDKFAVKNDVTCAALAGTATDFCTGQVKLLTQNIGQESFLVDDQRTFDAVYNEHLLDHTILHILECNRS